jgi:hypothetical protein
MVLLQLKMAGNGAFEAAKKALLLVNMAGYGTAVAAKKVLLLLIGAVAAAAAKDDCQWHCCSC